MDPIIAKTSQLELSSSTPSSYIESFDSIISYIHEIRKEPLSAAEIDCTRWLAGPFTNGGLLVILIEPLQVHPWHDGVNAVISRCPTLSALREGVSIGSAGTLSLLHNVSVLDLRPFICKEQKLKLEDSELERLYSLVLLVIERKCPDVVLCMGKEPRSVLLGRKSQLSEAFWKRTGWINADHQGCSVNHHDRDVQKLIQLLRSITKACSKLHAKEPGMPFTGISSSNTQEQLRLAERLEGTNDTIWVEILLWALIELCLKPPYLLPPASLLSNGFYQLEPWHEAHFTQILKSSDTEHNQRKTIAATLIPLFRRLNGCLKTTSWYLHSYEADWEEISSVLEDGLATLEDVCGRLDTNYESSGKGNPRFISDDRKIAVDVLRRGECVSFLMAELVYSGSLNCRINCRQIKLANRTDH